MNNYGFENRNYNKRKYTAWQYIAAFFSLILDYICENECVITGIKLACATLGIALFIGIVGGIELGTISAAVGFILCAVVLFGFIIFGEDK